MQRHLAVESPYKIWMMAARPRTLAITIIPILVGTLLALPKVQINWFLAFLTCASAVLIQVAINIFNDACDFKRGVDNEKRLGFKRVSQMGLMSPEQLLRGGIICYMAAGLLGIPLILVGGWPLAAVLLVSMIFGYLYTGGPYPLAYYGLGEVFVILFFGWECTLTAYYMQTASLDLEPFIAGTQLGLLSTAILSTNNLRDIVGDADNNKRTLAVLLGSKFARWEITLLMILPFCLGVYWIQKGYLFAGLLPCLTLPLVYNSLKTILTTAPSKEFNRIFLHIALIQMLFGLLWVLGYLLR